MKTMEKQAQRSVYRINHPYRASRRHHNVHVALNKWIKIKEVVTEPKLWMNQSLEVSFPFCCTIYNFILSQHSLHIRQ